MGITDRKTIELGLGFFKIWKSNRLGNGIWAKFGWENGIYTLPSGPSCP